MPKVSVIISTYNRTHYLRDAIASVLNQTFRDFELIIIDDGSTDGTQRVIPEFQEGIHYVRHEKNKGRAASRNKGLEMARGEYVAWLDSDDLWKPDHLEKGVWVLDHDREVDLVHGKVGVISSEGKPLENENKKMERFYRNAKQKSEFKTLVDGYPIFSSTVLFRFNCLQRVGVFDRQCAVREDFDWYLRFALNYRIYLRRGELTAFYRMHGGNATQEISPHEMAQEYVYIFQKLLGLVRKKLTGRELRKTSSRLLEKIAEFHFSGGERVEARKDLLQALKLNPAVLLHWRSIRRLIGLF